ncbi:MAG: TetR/AcrR family transcriptional regulator [Fibrobacteres bacterium]|nr:TetR/AcrR family transcriptional regulator [Fibrobacterota bacterium]
MGKARYHHGDLKNAILEASLELIKTSGLEAITLRAVATKLGVSHAAQNHHFPTRGALLGALAEQGFERFAATLESALEPSSSDPNEDRLLRVGRAYLNFARENPQHYRLLFGAELAMEADKTQGLRARTARPRCSPDSGGARALWLAVVHDVRYVAARAVPLRDRVGASVFGVPGRRSVGDVYPQLEGEVGPGDLPAGAVGLFGCALAFPGAGLEPFPGCVGTQAPTQGPSARPLGTRAPGALVGTATPARWNYACDDCRGIGRWHQGRNRYPHDTGRSIIQAPVPLARQRHLVCRFCARRRFAGAGGGRLPEHRNPLPLGEGEG